MGRLKERLVRVGNSRRRSGLEEYSGHIDRQCVIPKTSKNDTSSFLV